VKQRFIKFHANPPITFRVISLANKRAVFEVLSGPNRAWLLGVRVVAPRPLLSLYDIIYVTWYIPATYTKNLVESDCGRLLSAIVAV